jgi:hypothetical protein
MPHVSYSADDVAHRIAREESAEEQSMSHVVSMRPRDAAER